MDTLLAILLSPIMIFSTLGIASITFLIRTLIDYILSKPIFKATSKSPFYINVILPLLPLAIGVSTFTLTSLPAPEELSSNPGRAIFGLIAGLLSSTVYRLVKSQIRAKTEEKMREIEQQVKDFKDLETTLTLAPPSKYIEEEDLNQ